MYYKTFLFIRYTEEDERTKALGIALAFISFGCLVAPPFGGFLYQFCGKSVPFIILALICLIDGFLLLLIMRPMKAKEAEEGKHKPEATPMWRLLIDPHIACCAGALVVANISLAFLEPTISKWMAETMDAAEWQQGMIWLPASSRTWRGAWSPCRWPRLTPSGSGRSPSSACL